MNSTPTFEFTHDWFTGREFQLSLWLARFAHQPCHALEIGCFEGRSTVYFLRDIVNHKDSTITCIDTFQGSVEHNGIDFAAVKERFLRNIEPWKSKVIVHADFSVKVLLKLPANHYDFAYIDGSHKANDVYWDATCVWGLIKQGGVVIFDDYLWDGHAGTSDETKLGIDRFVKEVSGFGVPLPSYQLAVQKL